MTCISCGQELTDIKNGFVVCPNCQSVNVPRSSFGAVKVGAANVTGSAGSQSPALSGTAIPRRRLAGVLIMALLVIGVYGGYVAAFHAHPQTTHKTAMGVATKKSTPASAPTPPESGQSTPSAPAAAQPAARPASKTVTASAVPAPSVCAKGAYDAASGSNTPDPSGGLQQIVDTPQYYTVYGYTATQIRNELNQCSPAMENGRTFDSQTSWWLKYNYYWNTRPDGMCAISSAGVVVHITFVYPQWSNSAYAAAGLNSQWQTYMNNLTTHETGHKNLALQYAGNLYSGLLNLPETSCSSINQAATDYGNNELAALNQAEANYDTQTNHGATQGAVFP